MSMTVFMIWQMIGIFCAYFGVTLVLPLIVFRSLLRGKTVTNQILFSYLIGNFYIITMVQILQLLKISHTITLILATVVPAYIVWVKLNKVEVVKAATEVGINVKRVTEKHMGVKTAGVRMIRTLRKESKKLAVYVGKRVSNNWLEILLQLMVLGVLVYLYGQGIISTYGYTASDTPVHNYWINALSDNNIFVAGVYPHAYHCMLYYLHAVFGFKTYVLLSLFAFVQTVAIHFALIYLIKGCCKVPYISYIAVLLYSLGDFFTYETYARFAGTLPQEFGMIFILPCVYYGFEFFRVRYEEVKQEQSKKESWYSLLGFAMGFAMTLSAHFYNTIILGLFCVAIALGYLFLFVRKQYFGNVVITCLISLLVAILPMGIAFATGTRLEGSLYWASSIISGDKEDSSEDVIAPSINTEEINSVSINQNIVLDEGAGIETQLKNENFVTDDMDSKATVQKKSLGEVFSEKNQSIKNKVTVINNVENTYIWEKNEIFYTKLLWIMLIILLIEGCIYLLLRNTCYGAMLVSVTIYMLMMLLLLASGQLGLVTLMDCSRASIYFAYMIPIVVAMVLDALIYGVTLLGRLERIGKFSSVVCLLACVIMLICSNHMRKPYQAAGMETNEAITSLTNILKNESDFTWTICSANDELRMCEEYGYHYEMITLLRQMEEWDEEKVITIPTPKVFFFMEKIPLEYWETYENIGQTVSKEGASRPLPYMSGIEPYKGENRWITMSHMYYWAQEMLRMYPNEMKVYMETDNFVCYVMEQNTYSLVNLAIDYGYNTGEK